MSAAQIAAAGVPRPGGDVGASSPEPAASRGGAVPPPLPPAYPPDALALACNAVADLLDLMEGVRFRSADIEYIHRPAGHYGRVPEAWLHVEAWPRVCGVYAVRVP